ncbi:uncharacterized protein LOC128998431 [Macrosteles quadrilineatus]|uniref:uncharacterized protein LOC128998431 n=1 Tax=Macrosteles quadrilineatus TaxID=74068 RepID=UPI0023E0DA5F|nr:uncharacterized protein LOC128998431 [Macrosteles quadrilineatus]
MGKSKFYLTWLKVSINNSCRSDSFCLFSSDCNIQWEAVEVYFGKPISPYIICEEQSSDRPIEKNNIKTGIIPDCGDGMCLLYENGKRQIICQSRSSLSPSKRLYVSMDGYATSLFLFCLQHSEKYVELVTKHLSQQWSILYRQQSIYFQLSKMVGLIKLSQPQSHVLDLKWASMACHTIHELRQLQYAMSWLSTLGGAFSALGEEQEKCAKAAGVISVEQLRIALKLGDQIIISQCKLYFSLSLIQRGYCKLAKRIILEQYSSLKTSKVADRKTLNMCKGIWARLKYELQKRSRTNKISLVGKSRYSKRSS